MKIRYITPMFLAMSLAFSMGCNDEDTDKPQNTDTEQNTSDDKTDVTTPDNKDETTDPNNKDETTDPNNKDETTDDIVCNDAPNDVVISTRSNYSCSNKNCTEHLVIKSEAEFKALALDTDVTIDFSKNRVLVIQAGVRSHGGYLINVKRICGDSKKTTVTAVLESCSSGMSTSVMTYPRAYVIVPVSEAYEVELSENANVCNENEDEPVADKKRCTEENKLDVEELYARGGSSCHDEKCRKPGYELIKTEEEYEQTLLYSLDDEVTMPDMDKNNVLIVYAGERSHGGYSISVSSACSIDGINQIVVSIDSCKTAHSTQALTYPNAYFRVPENGSEYHVTFESNDNKCSE